MRKARKTLRPALLAMVAASCAFGAVGAKLPMRLREPGSVATPVRPFYSWELSLGRDTRAVVGPLDVTRALKVRITAADGVSPLDEAVVVCIDRLCETLEPAQVAADEPGAPSQELDLTELFSRLPRDPTASRRHAPKTYLTLQRRSPGPAELLSVSVLVETDRTSELPEYTEVRSQGE